MKTNEFEFEYLGGMIVEGRDMHWPDQLYLRMTFSQALELLQNLVKRMDKDYFNTTSTIEVTILGKLAKIEAEQ